MTCGGTCGLSCQGLACFLLKWGDAGTGAGKFDQPSGIAVGADGAVYVVDMKNHRVQRFSESGSYLGEWGSFGTGAAEFDHPTAAAVGPDGTVYVIDGNHSSVKRFTAAGSYTGQWGSYGHGNGEITFAYGIAVARERYGLRRGHL